MEDKDYDPNATNVCRRAWRNIRDNTLFIGEIHRNVQRTEKTVNFSLGFSVFTLVFVLFVELVIKK